MRYLLAALVALAFAAPATAQTPPAAAAPVKAAPELEARIAQLPDILNGGGDYDATFAPAFRAAIPTSSFDAVSAQLTAASGKAVKIEQVTPVTPWTAAIKIGYERGIASMEISVEAATPHQINGLRVTGMAGREASVGAVIDGLAALPGKTGFALARLDASGPVLLNAREADRPAAIGSEFKLVILAELVRGVAAGERDWDDTITLDGGPLPGGGFTAMPAGTKVTLYDLAEKMISISDNSAADLLLRTLGREKVEAMLPVVGVRDPKGMRPFLGALEAFKLKSGSGGVLGARWAGLDEAGRRRLLAGDVAAMPITAIDGAMFATGKPLRIDSIEWFASATDMIRIMDWLRTHTEGGPTARARTILTKNPGVGPEARARWQYVGYKGGSEPGVIAMTFLLQAKDGRWYALSGSWNNPDATVDDTRFAGLLTSTVALAPTN